MSLCCAGLAQAQPYPTNGIDHVDIHYMPTTIHFRRERAVSAAIKNDSTFTSWARYHLHVYKLEGLEHLSGLEGYLNAEHLTAVQPEDGNIRGLFCFTLNSGVVKRVYMTRDQRFHYEGRWYRSEELVELLFQYLASDARPPDYESSVPLSGIRADRQTTVGLMHKALRVINDSIDHARSKGILAAEAAADLRPYLYPLCDEIFGFGDQFFDSLPPPPTDCPLNIIPYRTSMSAALRFKDAPVYKIGTEMDEIISDFKSRSALVIEQLCECP